jgi:hypothetical protein
VRLLVIGGTQTALDLVEALRQPNQVEHVEDAGALPPVSAQDDTYDWVLVDETDGCAAEHAHAYLREMSPETPVSKVSVRQAPAHAPRRPMPMCAVETTSDGMQILRCALRHAAHNPEGDPALKAAIGERPLVFEYHAPTRKLG